MAPSSSPSRAPQPEGAKAAKPPVAMPMMPWTYNEFDFDPAHAMVTGYPGYLPQVPLGDPIRGAAAGQPNYATAMLGYDPVRDACADFSPSLPGSHPTALLPSFHAAGRLSAGVDGVVWARNGAR